MLIKSLSQIQDEFADITNEHAAQIEELVATTRPGSTVGCALANITSRHVVAVNGVVIDLLRVVQALAAISDLPGLAAGEGVEIPG